MMASKTKNEYAVVAKKYGQTDRSHHSHYYPSKSKITHQSTQKNKKNSTNEKKRRESKNILLSSEDIEYRRFKSSGSQLKVNEDDGIFNKVINTKIAS
jgi:hypothetical protein